MNLMLQKEIHYKPTYLHKLLNTYVENPDTKGLFYMSYLVILIKRSRDFPQVSELVIFLLLLYPLLARWGEWQFERERGEDKAIGTDF